MSILSMDTICTGFLYNFDFLKQTMFQLSGFDTRKETETQITEMVELECSMARAWLLSFEYRELTCLNSESDRSVSSHS